MISYEEAISDSGKEEVNLNGSNLRHKFLPEKQQTIKNNKVLSTLESPGKLSLYYHNEQMVQGQTFFLHFW